MLRMALPFFCVQTVRRHVEEKVQLELKCPSRLTIALKENCY